MSKAGPSVRTWIYGGSVLLHAALAVGAVMLPKAERTETVAIELADIKKKKEPPKPPPPPPAPTPEKPKLPPPPQAQPQAKALADAPKQDAPSPSPVGADGFAELGVALGNGAGEGIAAGVGPRVAAPAAVAATSAKPTTRRVEQLVPAAADVCSEPLVRPKRRVPVAPKYTLEARQAEIEGIVRVEVTVDETGAVITARVVSGLGYGLDESALAAAKASSFEPASRCGRRVVGTVVLPFRFEST